MTYDAADARQHLLDTVAEAIEQLSRAMSALGDAYEALDEDSADRLEAELFRPVQSAYGRAKRTHAEFAQRHELPAREFATPPGGSVRPVRELLERAADAIEESELILTELQDSMMPVEVGDAELRAGLAEVRTHVGHANERTERFFSLLGR